MVLNPDGVVSPQLLDAFAQFAEMTAQCLAQVLDEGDLDDDSRFRLGAMHRTLNELSAKMTGGIAIPAHTGRPTRAAYEDYADHVGSVACIAAEMSQALRSAAHHDDFPVWLDDLVEFDDTQLLQLRRVGAKSVAEIRELLTVYYWRGEAAESRALWQRIVTHLQQRLEITPFPIRPDRIEQGLAFARRVLEQDGQPLTNRHAPRLEVL
jgi:hypothetical protein